MIPVGRQRAICVALDHNPTDTLVLAACDVAADKHFPDGFVIHFGGLDGSLRVVGVRLLESGFDFAHPDLESALRATV